MSGPIVWWRKPYGGLDGHGASPEGRCEESPDPSDVGSVPRTDRLGNGPYTACFRTTNWTTRNIIHHSFGNANFEEANASQSDGTPV
jgi:hypothetical protein